jgi:hypothetical protein
MIKRLPRIGILGVFVMVGFYAPAFAATDRHTNYYYPTPSAIEEIDSTARRLAQANRRMRIGFVVGMVDQMLKRPYPPPVSLFVKGKHAEKMIVVANVTGRLDTLFRVRAFLATMTSVARASPMFTDLQVEDVYTFLDLLKMLGFKQITLSDGDTFAHQIIIK